MQERLDLVRLAPSLIVDLGCSRGASLALLQRRYADARTVGFDFVPEMLAGGDGGGWLRRLPLIHRNRPARVAADALALPLRAGAANLVWSNLLVHWLSDPQPLFVEIARVLETGGLLMFSTFGPDTLKELREAFADGYAHTQRFHDMHDLGDMLVQCGFSDPVMDMEKLVLTYPTLDQLFAEMRASGGVCAMQDRRRGMTGRSRWDRVRQGYERQMANGRLPATFEIVYGHAWKAEPRRSADGRAVIRFERNVPRR